MDYPQCDRTSIMYVQCTPMIGINHGFYPLFVEAQVVEGRTTCAPTGVD
ncbi:hypothetical protein [Coleofasciculus sp.]